MQRSSSHRDRATLFAELERLYKLGRIDTKACPQFELNDAVDAWAADEFSVNHWDHIEDLMIKRTGPPFGWVTTDSGLRWPFV